MPNGKSLEPGYLYRWREYGPPMVTNKRCGDGWRVITTFPRLGNERPEASTIPGISTRTKCFSSTW
jgi:hypothetical protein